MVGFRFNVRIKQLNGFILSRPLDRVTPWSKKYDPDSEEFDSDTEMKKEEITNE